MGRIISRNLKIRLKFKKILIKILYLKNEFKQKELNIFKI